MRECMLSGFRGVRLFETPWTVAFQAPLSMRFFSRQEYWSRLPCPPPGDVSNPGIEPSSPASTALQEDSLPTEPPGKPNHMELSGQKRTLGLLTHANRKPSGCFKTGIGTILHEGGSPGPTRMWLFECGHIASCPKARATLSLRGTLGCWEKPVHKHLPSLCGLIRTTKIPKPLYHSHTYFADTTNTSRGNCGS